MTTLIRVGTSIYGATLVNGDPRISIAEEGNDGTSSKRNRTVIIFSAEGGHAAMPNSLLGLQDRLRKDGVLISFSGKFSQEIIEELGEAVKKYLETEDHTKTTIFNIFSVFIEQTQNIKNYCASKDRTDIFETIASSGIVVIGSEEDGGTYICSGNLVQNADTAGLEKAMQEIVSLDKQALRKLYKQKLKGAIPPESKTAGMGLIDIARKASRPLQYSLQRIDESLSFFTLKATV